MKNFSKILILGLGISGKSALRALYEITDTIFVFDEKIKHEEDIPKEFKNYKVKYIYDWKKILENLYDFAVKSPGIKPSNPVIKLLQENNTEIISDLELGYILKNDGKIIAVTGTNGKTTTVTLINKVLEDLGKKSVAIGNIGVGAVDAMQKSDADFFVIEASSFQLDFTKNFKPDISVITNITEDHLDYHVSFENYKNAKLKIAKNQTPSDFLILNYDDSILKNFDSTKADKIFISAEKELRTGIYYKDRKIYVSENKDILFELDCEKIFIRGIHNYYNIMCVLAVIWALGIEFSDVEDSIYNFRGVEHRLEYVKEIKGIKYFNDSKGTNPDSTMKAVDSFESDIIIILGGYDKKISYRPLLKFAKPKIKAIITLGETKENIFKEAQKLGYENIFKVESLEQAVKKANNLAKENDIVLLSPASASWDMFKNYEERGNEFKRLVNCINED